MLSTREGRDHFENVFAFSVDWFQDLEHYAQWLAVPQWLVGPNSDHNAHLLRFHFVAYTFFALLQHPREIEEPLNFLGKHCLNLSTLAVINRLIDEDAEEIDWDLFSYSRVESPPPQHDWLNDPRYTEDFNIYVEDDNDVDTYATDVHGFGVHDVDSDMEDEETVMEYDMADADTMLYHDDEPDKDDVESEDIDEFRDMEDEETVLEHDVADADATLYYEDIGDKDDVVSKDVEDFRNMEDEETVRRILSAEDNEDEADKGDAGAFRF